MSPGLVDIADELAEALAANHLLAGGETVLGEVRIHRVDPDSGRSAEMVEAAVASDPVEPGPDVDLTPVGEDRVEGGREDLLQNILGVLARAEHVAAKREQADLVATDERLEGLVLATADQCDEALIGLEAQ